MSKAVWVSQEGNLLKLIQIVDDGYEILSGYTCFLEQLNAFCVCSEFTVQSERGIFVKQSSLLLVQRVALILRWPFSFIYFQWFLICDNNNQ